MKARFRRSVGVASAAVGVVVGSSVPSAPEVGADVNYNPSTWNGHRVYLSPARHADTGSRGECASDENSMAFATAVGAANGIGSNLVSRQYKVQVGDGTVASAIANSNAFGAHAHIPIHSNARPESCSNTNAAQHGTVVIYRDGSSAGSTLAAHLVDKIGAVSPGTSDLKCHNPGHPCTTINLAELRDTAAPAAYLEAEFHTWNTGVNWLQQTGWKWRIGYAVDLQFNYPRA